MLCALGTGSGAPPAAGDAAAWDSGFPGYALAAGPRKAEPAKRPLPEWASIYKNALTRFAEPSQLEELLGDPQ
jgi:hypothetical protein